ncbi:penicillin amidase [Bradyrhizobium sp. JR7.2]|uniref:penicillin acylase family protein n=1 Tax=Bradyrhizobium TaxID=374 RepID=UPI0024AF4B18|nr:penicillin acylase family protein [Bradyrhizobium barranii]WFT93525.1 penicillin acylase family protein [Bradyrhizobium barranii]
MTLGKARQIDIDGLSNPAELWRDEWGIPHIRAQTQDDAFTALGFAHAEDRLWQMDLMRRKAYGRWAEWRGEAAVPGDMLARRLGGEMAAKRDFEALNGEARAMLIGYAKGVNAFIRRREYPVEYALLKESPEIWRPWDSIAVMRQIGFLMGSVWLKLFRAAALPAIGPDLAMALRYDDAGEDDLCIPPGTHGRRIEADLAALQPAIRELLELGEPDLTGGGSNNWALSGHVTGTGRPILMGDPHRELEVPAIYVQAHIACDRFDAVGICVPGVPGFPHVAHNGKVAWCVTHAFMDIHDLFIERFRADGKEVLFRESWQPTRRRTERIKVRGSDAVDVEILETAHGPVVVGDPKTGCGLVLRSVQFADTDTSFNCLPRMLTSPDVQTLFDAVDEWGLIDHNLVAADTRGQIGHRVRAKVPARGRVNGWLPVPGWTGEYEWNGMIAASDMPRVIDPPEHRIVTANNRVVSDTEQHYFCTDCHPPHRARRIAQLIDGLARPTIKEMEPIYGDYLSAPALLFKNRLQTLSFEGAAEDVRQAIVAWDGRMTASSHAAACYAELRLALTKIVAVESGLSKADCTPGKTLLTKSAILTHFWWVVPSLLRADDKRWLGGKTWEAVLRQAAEEVAGTATALSWGELHAPDLQHPLSPVFPEAAETLNVRSAVVGGDNDTVFATGLNAGEGFEVKYSALVRHSFDVGAWENSRWIVFQGSSGVPGNRHRSDQNELWASCASIPMLYDWSSIEGRSSLQHLEPAGDSHVGS